MNKKNINIKKILFVFGIFFTLFIPLGIQIGIKDSTAAWIALLCVAFVSLMAKYDEIIEISFGPISARMKDKIIEATATISQLKKVSLAQSKAMLTNMMASSFLGNMPFKNKLLLHDDVIKSLKEIEIDDEEINRIDEMWQKGIGIHYLNLIRATLENRKVGEARNPDTTKEVMAVSDSIQEMLDFPTWTVPSPEKIENIINSKAMMKPEIQECINDYKFYLENKQIKRKELFE